MAQTSDTRPQSPHLQVWRWHVTMATSIAHRLSGVALYVGAIVLTIWLGAIAAGPDAYEFVSGHLMAWYGRLVLFGFTLAATYHLANGVRHLVWDTGSGFRPETAGATAWFAFLFAAVAAFGVWAAAYWL